MTLEILICTIDENINKVPDVIMTPHQDITYLVSWEQTSGKSHIAIPEALQRPDVRIVTLSGKGLSRNRNNAIDNANGDICLIANDDVKYGYLKVSRVLDVFEEHPTLDLATFKYESESQHKDYPSFSFDLRHKPHNYSIYSVEIAFRRTSIQGKLKFNEFLGLGIPEFGSGEDELFILDSLNANLNCKFFPIEIVTQNKNSASVIQDADMSTVKAKGMLLRIYYPNSYLLHYAMAAHRLNQEHGIGFFKAFNNMMRGYKYAKKNKLLNYNIEKIDE